MRFRTHYLPQPTVHKKQQQLLRPTEMVPKDHLNNETSRVRALNRSVSEVVLSMRHVQARPGHRPRPCEKWPSSFLTEDSTQCIQTVTLHHHQNEGVRSKESLLRNNYGKEDIKNELSAAPQPTGAQGQQSSEVRVPELLENDDGEEAINGQRPRSALTACAVDKGVNSGTPPRGNKWSLARRGGKVLKWRNCSQMVGRHAQWTRRYNGIRYRMQYAHWQTVRPRLKPISEWEERVSNEGLTHIAQSVEHETLNPRVVGSSPLEISQKQSLYVSCHIPSYVSSNQPPISQSSCLLKRSDVLESD